MRDQRTYVPLTLFLERGDRVRLYEPDDAAGGVHHIGAYRFDGQRTTRCGIDVPPTDQTVAMTLATCLLCLGDALASA